MFYLTITLVIASFIIFNTVVIVHSNECGVLERLGKFEKVMEPGIHFLIPFVDRIAYLHEMREQVLDVPSQNCITRDNIQVEVDGVVFLKILDAKNASYSIGNYGLAAVNLAQTTMRSEIGKLALHEAFSERESLNRIVVEEIDKASASWGVKVLRYEIMNIIPSRDVVHALEQAMEAERDRRAEVTKATAEKEALNLVSEGMQIEAVNLSEGEREKRVNIAEGRAYAIETVAKAEAYSLECVAKALSAPGGESILNMRVVEKYTEEFGKILKESDISVVPMGLAQMKGFFEGVEQITSKIGGK